MQGQSHDYHEKLWNEQQTSTKALNSVNADQERYRKSKQQIEDWKLIKFLNHKSSDSENEDILKEQSAINGLMSKMSAKLDQFMIFMGLGSCSGGDEEQRESGSEEAAAEIEIWDNSDSDIDKVLERQLLDSICKRYKKTGRTDGFHGAKIYI
ncbi:8582_t:CDS:2 [Rhizophagus irregularis]|nr:8582_t:CDS:2 [Rhizophagus irregularis]